MNDALARIRADRDQTLRDRDAWREAGRRAALDRLSWRQIELIADPPHPRGEGSPSTSTVVIATAQEDGLDHARADEIEAYRAGVQEVREAVLSAASH